MQWGLINSFVSDHTFAVVEVFPFSVLCAVVSGTLAPRLDLGFYGTGLFVGFNH